MFSESQQIGIYKLIRKLGRGGFGEVWLAEKTSEGFRTFTKKVAVKLPHSEQIDFRAIEQEAMLWEQVSGHANVLPIIDADIYDGQVVIVSEYAEGGSLAEKLEKDGKFSVKKAVEMTIGILKGLEFLHNKQIIHRDIKPQNILLQGDTPRLADFGISRAMQTTTVSSKIVGTDAYMSPEALDGKRNVQTDVWSVGVVLYELLKDDLPFPQEHPSERMFAILMKDYEPLSLDIPYKLRDIVNKALAKKPEERYLSATAMREDLTAFLAQMLHLNHAETKPFPKEDLAETKRIIESGEQNIRTDEQNFLPDTVQPRKLKELNELGQTQAAVTQSSLGTQANNFSSNQISNPLPTEALKFANTSSTAKQKNPRAIYIGAAVLALLTFGSIFATYWLFFRGSKVVINNSNVENQTVKNKVLNGDRIRIGKDLKGWVSSNNEMVFQMQITGIGEEDVIEEIRKDKNLQIKINGQTNAFELTEISNGSILNVRVAYILNAEQAQAFKNYKPQDFVVSVDIFYKDEVVSKKIETKFQKSKGNNPSPSLGDLVAFGDILEKNVAPQTTPKPIVSNPTPTPVQRNDVRQSQQTTQQQSRTTLEERNKSTPKPTPKRGTTVGDDGLNPVIQSKEGITATPNKIKKAVGDN